MLEEQEPGKEESCKYHWYKEDLSTTFRGFNRPHHMELMFPSFIEFQGTRVMYLNPPLLTYKPLSSKPDPRK